jgi:SAM-dependent methyltransferase
MNLFGIISKVLSLPAGYRLFQWLVGRERATRTYLAEYAKPVAGEKVLDIGCGPADLLNLLPAVRYSGLDLSPEYIAAARHRFGARGRFVCGDVGLATMDGEVGTFDLVIAFGVVHHLDDAQAGKLFELARRMLNPSGRLVTLDGCYVPGQPRLARWLLARDRGKYVRTQEEYLRLASGHFSLVAPGLRQDLLRIPYAHLILRCSQQRVAAAR